MFDTKIKNLKSRLDYMHNLSIKDLIEFFSELSKQYNNFKNLSDFLKKENLQNNLKIALRDYNALDKFVDLGDDKLLFHAQPCGLTVHWLAGNVPVLGLFSIFSALLTKNVCLVKASSRGHKELIDWLNLLSKTKTNKINGKELKKSIAVILLDRNNKKAHEKLSLAADVRIAWGGHEAVNTIINLQKDIFCEDIIFGPKYSYAVIDKESLKKDIKKLAQKLAIDISVFDQYACSSPHTVFVQGNALKFAQELAKQMDFVNKKILPKAKTDSAKAAEIVSLRTEYEFKGRVFASSGTEWTVIYTKEPGLAQACFSRAIFVKPIHDLKKLADYNDRQKQTLGLGLTKKNRMQYLDLITRKGIDRCPDLGYMTFYESPWDGMFVFNRLVRWVSVYK